MTETPEPTPFDVFSWGVDYGQLLMEEERDSEEWADAFHGAVFARKMCMPATPLERRQSHSEEWRAAKKASLNKFMDYIIQHSKNESNENDRKKHMAR